MDVKYKNERHAWNIVDVGHAPYQLDITWDIGASSQKRRKIAYDYFDLTDSLIMQDHKCKDILQSVVKWLIIIM